MPSVTCVALAAGLLLVVAGADKVLRPRPLHRAVRTLGLPLPVIGVRVVAGAEAMAGAAATLVGGSAAWLAAALVYAVLAGFVVGVRRRGGRAASCGCFGATTGRADPLHVVVTAAYAVAAAVAAGRDAPGLLRIDGAGPRAGMALVGAVLAYLSYAVLTALPQERSVAGTTRGGG